MQLALNEVENALQILGVELQALFQAFPGTLHQQLSRTGDTTGGGRAMGRGLGAAVGLFLASARSRTPSDRAPPIRAAPVTTSAKAIFVRVFKLGGSVN